jgi:predicted nucleotidyltransferase
MVKAIDGWLGLYEACYLMQRLAQEGEVDMNTQATSGTPRAAEPPAPYGLQSAKRPAPQHLLAALLNGAQVLNGLHAHYVVGGGLAINMHGRDRATRDVDFFLLENPDRLEPVIAALKTRDLFPHAIEQPSFMPPDALFWWAPFQYGLPDAPPVDVDLLVSEDEFMAFLHASGREHSINGVRLRVLSAASLILLKLKAYRLRDQDDLIFLFRANPNLDRELLGAWAKKFKIEDRLAEMEQKAREYRRFG